MARTSTTSVLLAEVASELHLDTTTCRAVVREFLRKSAQFLAQNQHLNLEGLGSFRLYSSKHVGARLRYKRRRDGSYPKMRRVVTETAVHVSFTKSKQLSKLARDYLEASMSIEKYGVDEGTDSEQLEKQAASGCPDCGSKPERHGRVLSCPRCGTEPFERQKNSGTTG